MPKLKSLIIRVEVDTAKKAHDCHSNHRHRIKRGEGRLKVRNGRSWQPYCMECAKAITRNDIKKLEALAVTLEKEHGVHNEPSCINGIADVIETASEAPAL